MKEIVIDIYGADLGTDPVLYGVAKALKDGYEFLPVLVGDTSVIRAVMDGCGIADNCYRIIHTEEYFKNTDLPTAIYGAGDNCSMSLAFGYLKDTENCIAMLSPGSTGIMLVGSICRLGLIGGLKFPALSSALPCAGEKLLCIVDCGANTDCTPNDLVRFAKMGTVFSKAICGFEDPRVGLMSVGREEGKGNDLIKKAYPLLKELDINFIGNLEGSDMVSGYADVVVCDGFSGNLLLKSVEAAGKAAMDVVDATCPDRETAEKIKHALFKKFDFNSQGAATFLGTKKMVCKMHGAANADTTVASIDQILRVDRGGFNAAMKDSLK